MKSKKGDASSNTTSTIANSSQVAITWPANNLPIEIFTLIISYLPRSNIQIMRLVNKEFEEKVSEYLFKVVVVPFKPEIYGIAPEPLQSGSDTLQGAVMLQDKGMRVFQGFGRRIRKFAMSFEFDENKLANPPIKSDQEAITAFWGIYRWPFKKYNRYSQLEGLEQTADETRTMAKALRFIECAKELGLSIDGGLGWLAGPDVNLKAQERGDKVSVFGESRFVPELKVKSPLKGKTCKAGSVSTLDLTSGNTAVEHNERMLSEAGYTGDALEESVQLLLETEDASGEATRSGLLERVASHHHHNTLGWGGYMRQDRAQAAENTSTAMNAPGEIIVVETSPASVTYILSEDDDEVETSHLATASNKGKGKIESPSLKPNNLSNAQREMLLEIEWAQRAFMQSYTIAIIDNPKTFEHIETLTIARLPNRHLPILRREDFWESLPQVNKLSLTIIPDWREVAKLPTSWVQDMKLAPSQSISGVYQILNEQVARRKNIKTLHFEWLCGGEEAPGLFSRNKHILAAPLVLTATDMLNRKQQPAVLSLPFVEHFSLKNCWVSPHIFSTFAQLGSRFCLQSLTLNSISLTAPALNHVVPLPVNVANMMNAAQHFHQAAAANNAHANQLLMNMQQLHGVAAQNVLAPPAAQPAVPAAGPASTSNSDWLDPPRSGTWASIIETFTPGATLAQQRFERDDTGPEPPARLSRLTKLEFKSCGYIRLPLDFDQSILEPPEAFAPQISAITKRISDLDSYMMKPSDSHLGVIINHIDPAEAKSLENGFLMTVGWDKFDPIFAVLASEALIDGIAHPGKGRFGGVIEKRHRPSTGR